MCNNWSRLVQLTVSRCYWWLYFFVCIARIQNLKSSVFLFQSLRVLLAICMFYTCDSSRNKRYNVVALNSLRVIRIFNMIHHKLLQNNCHCTLSSFTMWDILRYNKSISQNKMQVFSPFRCDSGCCSQRWHVCVSNSCSSIIEWSSLR